MDSWWTAARRWVRRLLAPLQRVVFGVRGGWRRLRILRPVTRMFGPQYVRSRDAIEIDITYACNLRCTNCNRSVTQAPEKAQLEIARIRDFVNESIAAGKRWRRIRVLGGEPTLHPQFFEIIDLLLSYRAHEPGCRIQVVSNGHGEHVKAMLARLPAEVDIENSGKHGNFQPAFGAFNLAPADDPAFRHADFVNGCSIMTGCGMGLGIGGYYPCAVAAGIDRVLGQSGGRASLPADEDEMADLARRFCRLCGHFREGHDIPEHLREPLLGTPMSPTWVAIYADWRHRRKDSTRRCAG